MIQLFRSMVRLVLIVLLACVFAHTAFAQGDDMRDLRHASTSNTWIGLRGGAVIANQSVNDTLDASSTGARFGFHGGLQVDQWFGNMWAVSVSALFEQKGIHESYSSNAKSHPATHGDDDYSFTYLEIPVVIKAAFGAGDARPYVFAGPSVGFLLSSEETVTETVPAINGLKSYLATTDMSILVGAGFMDKLSDHMEFTLDAGYAAGLSKIYQYIPPVRKDAKSGINLIDNSGAKSGDFRVAVSLLFGL
jgi:hypothetical protein